MLRTLENFFPPGKKSQAGKELERAPNIKENLPNK